MTTKLRKRLLARGDRAILIDEEGNARSGRELLDRVERLAAALAHEGLTGHRVAVWYENSFAAFEAYLAIEWIGATRVVLDPRAARTEASAVLQATNTGALLADTQRAESIADIVIAHDDHSELGGATQPPLTDVPGDRPLHFYPRAVHAGQAFAIQISYDNWAAAIDVNARLYRSGRYGRWDGDSEVMLTLQQLLHGTGLMGSFPFLHMGLPQVCARTFVPEHTADLIDRFRVTSTGMTSGMLARWLDALPSRRLPSLRRLLYGGAPLSLEQLHRALDRLGEVLVQVYGRLEGGWPLTILDQNDHAAIATGRTELGASCGRKNPDPRLDLRTRPGGELCTRSPMAVSEYCDPDGWCGLGDLAHIDSAGYVFLRGRLDRMINIGYHVYPEEVEEALTELPGVRSARVVGQSHERRGTVLAAYVLAEPGSTIAPEGLGAALRERLAAYKIPRVISIVDALEDLELPNDREAGG